MYPTCLLGITLKLHCHACGCGLWFQVLLEGEGVDHGAGGPGGEGEGARRLPDRLRNWSGRMGGSLSAMVDTLTKGRSATLLSLTAGPATAVEFCYCYCCNLHASCGNASYSCATPSPCRYPSSRPVAPPAKPPTLSPNTSPPHPRACPPTYQVESYLHDATHFTSAWLHLLLVAFRSFFTLSASII